ncbi:pimeloyl-ACP methyl ester carboxylesterase [Paenibacillus sp. W4I10]|uniref:ABC-three component system protein n=1 Tax=Paenibacillus sp. W4I10 TaxID=3042298 RepID=UPI00278B90C0|nr:ABC-three component system protein [Paenibacillus sp. W4I10]MDQ0719226.1 pimeloyl-ACP methyl ester carboxylesterase [Paenibacillus sp. W4I10]
MNTIEFISRNNKVNLILFIHGFTGSQDTWKNGTGQEFPKMLIEEEGILEHYDVAYVSYYTTLIDLYGLKSRAKKLMRMLNFDAGTARKNVGIEQLGEFIQAVIQYNCESYENIVIVAHSMGGLVAKSYILNELQQRSTAPQVKLFLSLAVPHTGSDWAKLGEKLFRNVQAIDLNPLSHLMSQINRSWIENSNTPRTVCFYGHYDDVVSEDSAVLLQVNKPEKVPCDEDHNSITRPSDKNRLIFVAVKSILQNFAKDTLSQATLNIQEFIDTGQMDDEVFVIRLLIADVHNIHVSSAKQTFFNAEYMRKVLTNQGDQSIMLLTDLYAKIEFFYTIAFGKLMSKELTNSNHLVTYVHDQIMKEPELLNCAIPLLSSYHKTGMLHQLMNKLEKDLWWAQDHNIQTIEQFREARRK